MTSLPVDAQVLKGKAIGNRLSGESQTPNLDWTAEGKRFEE
jgi:hypothetical protein